MAVKRDLVVDNIHSSRPPGDEGGSLVNSIGLKSWLSITIV